MPDEGAKRLREGSKGGRGYEVARRSLRDTPTLRRSVPGLNPGSLPPFQGGGAHDSPQAIGWKPLGFHEAKPLQQVLEGQAEVLFGCEVFDLGFGFGGFIDFVDDLVVVFNDDL